VDQRGDDATEDTTSKDILILGDARKRLNKFFVQIGDVLTPEGHPEIANRNAVAAFEDFAE